MELLEQRILKDGKVLPGGILKVDSFLNHQMDPELLYEMGRELGRLFADSGVNKILTIEASGIAIAVMAGLVFRCPVVFAKKSKTKNISDSLYQVQVESFTHGNTNTVARWWARPLRWKRSSRAAATSSAPRDCGWNPWPGSPR